MDLPPTVPEILRNVPSIRARYPRQLDRKRRTHRTQWFSPLVSWLLPQADTPAVSFHRIYTFFVLNDTIALRNELEYFCCSHPEWPVSALPEPKLGSEASSDERVRYTILAVLTHLMCASFNRRIEMGLPRDAPAIIEDFEELAARPKVYEQVPDWAKHVEPLPETIFLPDAEGRELAGDDEAVSKEFKDVNIIVQMPHIHFV